MISVLLPTTGRPDRAEKCIRELRDSTDAHDVEIVCAVDADQDSRDRLLGLVDHLDYCPTLRGCSNAWNECLALSTGEYVVFAADDLRWGDGWLDEALTVMRDSFGPDGGLVGFNDGHWGPELSTHYLMSRDFIRTVLGGVIAWPEYKHSFNDLEVNERARTAKRYAWAEDAHVYHEHWLFGDRPQDETDARRLPDHPADQDAFNRRQAAGFPDTYEAVI